MRGRQIRYFLVILGLTALVWLAVAMSEKHEYSIPVKVEMTGFDAKRYAVLEADSSLMLQIESSGFNALFLSLKKEPVTIQVDMQKENVRRYRRHSVDGRGDLCRAVSVSDLSGLLERQLSSYGIRQLGSNKDSLMLILGERSSKTFRPDISDVRINFADGYGLYGQPLLVPAEVTLYGPQEILATISQLKVQPVEFDNVHETANFRVALDTSWKALGDIYTSDSRLTIRIPVERYVEREYSVPVTIEDVDTTMHIRLYPDHATLRVWVAEEDVPTVTADRFKLSADYRDILSQTPKLKLRLSQFPESVRVRSIGPEEIQYVIIK